MSCPINRYKFTTSNIKPSTSEGAKEIEARMKEILAIRAAQDGGNFTPRPSWDPIPTTPTTPTTPTNSKSALGTIP